MFTGVWRCLVRILMHGYHAYDTVVGRVKFMFLILICRDARVGEVAATLSSE